MHGRQWVCQIGPNPINSAQLIQCNCLYFWTEAQLCFVHCSCYSLSCVCLLIVFKVGPMQKTVPFWEVFLTQEHYCSTPVVKDSTELRDNCVRHKAVFWRFSYWPRLHTWLRWVDVTGGRHESARFWFYTLQSLTTRAGEMALRVEVLATQPGDASVVTRIHVKGRTSSTKL